MAFNLPAAQYLMTSNSSTNRGTDGSPATGTKNAGNLPITTNAAQLQNNTASSQTGAPDRIYFGLTSQNSTTGFDVSSDTRVLVTSVQYNAPNRIQSSDIVNEGASITLVSGATEANYRRFLVGGFDTPFCSAQAGPITICMDLNDSSHDSSGGTYDNTDASGWGFGCVRFNLSATSTLLCFFQRVFLFQTTKDASNIPNFTGAGADWDDAFTAVQGSSYTTKIGAWITKAGSTFFVPCPFQFGDGSTATTFDDEGVNVVSPGSNIANQENFRLTAQAMRVYLSQRNNAADSVTLSGTYTWGTAAPWDFDEDNLAACTIDGATFNGMGNFTLGGSCTGAATFSLASGSDVIINDAVLDGSTINGDCQLQTDTDLTDIHITGDLRVAIGADATLNLSNVQVDGDIFNDSGSNTLTINGSNGSSLSTTEPGTGNGEVNIVNTVTITVTCLDSGGSAIENARLSLEADSGGPLPALESVTSITRSGSTATVTHTSHGYTTGNTAIIRGATENEYNGAFTVTVTGANTYTYTVSGTPATPATGTITSTAQILGGLTNSSGIVTTSTFNFVSNQPVTGRARKASSAPFFKTAPLTGTITLTGLSVTVVMIGD